MSIKADMKKILCFGTSVFAEVVYKTIMQDDADRYEVLGFVIDDEYYSSSSFCGKTVYRYSELEKKFNSNDCSILICIGYANMNGIRKKIFSRLDNDGWCIADYINRRAIVRACEWGRGNIVLDGVNIGIDAKVGDGNVFYPNSLLAHHSSIGDFNFFAVSASVAGYVSVGSFCFFGNNCSTKDHIVIKDGVLVGGGCYLGNSVYEPYTVWAMPQCKKLTMSSIEVF